jgi:RNA polymerase sigma-70 factor (ECF subfamily)
VESIQLRERLLVLRAQVGDEEAFAELFRHFGEKTHRHLRSLLGHPEADDAQQEVWLTVYRRIGSLANPAGFRTWLFQTTRNRAIDRLRRTRREQALYADPETLLALPDGAEEDAGLDLDDRAIAGAMEGLPPRLREVLVLRFWEGLAYPEIALVTGTPIGTVRSRLFHAKRLLRERLERTGARNHLQHAREKP